MSSHSDHEIPFSISQSHLPLRLLELPQELLQLLTSASPPILQLKSQDDTSATAEAALCTQNKTYQMRQVQTSNSVYVVTGANIKLKDSDGIPRLGLNTVAQCSWTLEVSPSPNKSAESLLRQALPIYTGLEDDGVSDLPQGRSKPEVFNDIPLSEDECEQAWSELVAFEISERSSCFRPTAAAMIKAWSAIASLAIERGIDLSAALRSTDLEELTRVSDDIPSELAGAVLRRLLAVEQRAIIRTQAFADVDVSTTLNIDRASSVCWIGTTLLESLSETKKVDFLKQWQDLLPESWREDAKLSAIEGQYKTSSDGKSRFLSVDERSTKGSHQVSTTPNATGAKRKWHEKFAQARKR